MQSYVGRSRIALFIGWIAVLASSSAAASHDLELDTRRIALRKLAIAVDLGAELRDAGVAHTAVEVWPIPGWSLVQLDASHSNAAGVEETIARISSGCADVFASPVYVGLDGGPVWYPSELLVRFDPAISHASAREAVADAVGGTILVAELGGMERAYRVSSSARNGFEALELARVLERRGDVRSAEPDAIFTGRGELIPNDPGFGSCWGLHNTGQFGCCAGEDMNAPAAWDVTTGSSTAIVVVIDTGVELAHPDLNTTTSADFTGEGGGGNPVSVCDKHGTAVAGCVSAKINNSLGTVGVAPNCPTSSARTFISNLSCNGSWTSQASWTVNALAFAQSIGAKVTNNSNGYGFTSTTIDATYQSTYDAGLVHFASAGNGSGTSLTYPASVAIVNSVAAIDPTGALASFSNSGAGLDFSAPGDDVYTTDLSGAAGYSGGDYALVWGTSFASPYTAGVAALIRVVNPSWTPAQVEQKLQQSAVDHGATGYDTTYGWGVIDAWGAVAPPCVLPAIYCTAKLNSASCAPSIASSGWPTFGGSTTFTISSTGFLNKKSGLLFYGTEPLGLAFQGGHLCVKPPITRTVVQNSGGSATGSDCTGTYSDDFEALILAATDPALIAGAFVYAQYWARDPADIAGFGTSLSDALSFQICP